MRKKRDEERQKQLRWREEHRVALLQGNVPPRSSGDSERYTGRPPPGGLEGSYGTGTRAGAGLQAYRQKQWRRVGIFAAGMGRLKSQVHGTIQYKG